MAKVRQFYMLTATKHTSTQSSYHSQNYGHMHSDTGTLNGNEPKLFMYGEILWWHGTCVCVFLTWFSLVSPLARFSACSHRLTMDDNTKKKRQIRRKRWWWKNNDDDDDDDNASPLCSRIVNFHGLFAGFFTRAISIYFYRMTVNGWKCGCKRVIWPRFSNSW